MNNLKKNKSLWDAFEEKNEKKFTYLLEMGENPEEDLDHDTSWTTFELICGKDAASYYLKKCIEHGADPNRVNPIDGQHPIHIAVKNLKLANIRILLEADADCANQTFRADKTSLHILAKLVTDSNIKQVFAIIKLLSEYGADFSWPAHQSFGETPFSLLLKNLSQRMDKAVVLAILRYLIHKYPTIIKFQRTTCTNLMQKHFAELMVEYEQKQNLLDLASNKGPLNDWDFITLQTLELNWWQDLASSLKEGDSKFLVRLRFFKNAKKSMIKDAFSDQKFENHTKKLLDLAIKHDRFESFVEIFSIMALEPTNISISTVVEEVLKCERYRILKFLINHSKVEEILDGWLITIMLKINWKLTASNSCHKCFYLLLKHPKFNIGREISDCYKESTLFYELNCAATESEDVSLALLKRNPSLGIRDHNNRMMVQYMDDEVLKKFLDSCITTQKQQNMSDNDFFLVIDYSFLESPKEMLPIEYISSARNLQQLIVHPVIASFLFLRWFQLRNVFYINLLLFTIFTISSCLYLVFPNANLDQMSHHPMWTLYILKMVTFLSFFIFCFKELGQMWSSRMTYWKSAENYLEIFLLSLMGMVLVSPLEDGHDQFRRVITSIFIMGIAVELTLMLSALPMFIGTNYLVMLKKVAINFMRMLAFYLVILFAFALSFYTLMGAPVATLGNSTTPSLETTIFNTFLMMTGDFDLNSENEQNVTFVRILLVIFVLSITVVLMNLLLGLTISDTAAIESQAELYNWLHRAKLLSKYDRMVSNCYPVFKRFGLHRKLKSLIQLIPDFLPMKKIKIAITQNVNGKWIYIPDHMDLFIDGTNQFPSKEDNAEILKGSFFWFKSIITMDKRIVQSGLEILERRKQLELEREQ